MAWVVDTCIVIDVLEDDPEFGEMSARLVDSKAEDGVVVAPVTYVELAPAFLGDRRRQDEFLMLTGIRAVKEWSQQDTAGAYNAWQKYVIEKRKGTAAKRPIADILIGAFASRRDGLLTRNPNDFLTVFPDMKILAP